MYEIGDKIIYGIVGVCVVEDIAKPPIKGIDGEYYFLQPVYDKKGIIYSPVNSTKAAIRPIMTKKECDFLIECAKDCKNIEELNTKIVPYQYEEILKSQEPKRLLHLIRVLYNVKNQRLKDLRKMKSIDSRFLNSSKKLLYGEMAAVCEQEYSSVEEQMDELLSIM